jgi:YD repeat-containing protein
MKKICLVAAFLVTGLFSFCQSANYGQANYPQIVPPSPEAASLGKYGAFSVSLFSGTPQISIPIYDFKYGDIGLKIGLVYNAGGIRVDDVATNVGLGWSLSAGGVVTKAIRGVPDDMNQVSFPGNNFNPSINSIPIVNSPNYPDYVFALNAVNNNWDLERDIYYYNFLGNSGKFVIDRNNVPRLIPANPNIKIDPYNGHFYNGFIITDDKGYKYYFTDLESSGPSSSVCTLGQESSRENYGNNNACYLSKIVSPDNRQVFLEYDIYTYTLESGYSEVQYENQQPIFQGCDASMAASNRKCKKVVTVNGLRIKKIFSEDNSIKVDFLYSATNRLDLKYNNQAVGNYLESIKIYYNNVQRKLWSLSYGYFNQNYAPRLKLLEIQEGNIPPYQFTYNESHPLPERLSLDQDHWGFYNGKLNTTFIPPVMWANKITGADRSPDFDYMKSGTLIKMTYPTGGYTEFEYEPHKETITENVTTYQQGNASVEVTANVGDYLTATDFTLPLNAVGVNWSWYLTMQNYDDFTSAQVVSASDPPTYYKYADGPGSGGGPATNIPSYQACKVRLYRSNVADHGYVSVGWQYPVTTTVTHEKIMYGGLRIKAMKNYDFANHIATSKYYEYNSTVLPADAEKVYCNIIETVNSDPGNGIPCGYWQFSSFSVPGLGTALEQGVGYEEVIEKNIANGSTGRTIYKYSNGCSGIGISINSNSNTELGRGLLLEKTDQLFNSATSTYENVAKTKNTYQSVYNSQCEENGNYCMPNESITPNLKLSMVLPERFYGGYVYAAKWNVEKFYTVSVPFYLQKTENTTYVPGTSNELKTTTNYFYDNTAHLYPTKIETNNSKGELIKTINRGPFEKNDINAVTPLTTAEYAAIDEMVNRNIVSPVLQTEQYNGVSLLNRTLITYKNWGGNILKPEKAKYQNEYSPIETKYLYNKYDDKGNLQERQKESDVPETYLWGYNQEYPVVKIVGKAYWEIAWLINQTVLNSPPDDATFRTHLNIFRTSLPGAHVYTYTYKPLIGITSETDPNGKTTYYEYDALNRLAMIRDKDNNIIKKICYNYAGQVENCVSGCTNTNPNWQNTNTTLRCQFGSCGNTGYQEQEQRDMNVCSPTYNQTQWVTAGYNPSVCPIPTCGPCANTNANWQNTSTALRCQQVSCGNTGYQEQEQKDMNACSPTYNQTQWVVAGYNPTACPVQNCVNLTSTNIPSNTGYTATYYNTSTSVTYNFSVPTASGLQALGILPTGTYNLTISRTTGTPLYATFKSGCNKFVITGISATYYNIPVSTTTCNSITVNTSFD